MEKYSYSSPVIGIPRVHGFNVEYLFVIVNVTFYGVDQGFGVLNSIMLRHVENQSDVVYVAAARIRLFYLANRYSHTYHKNENDYRSVQSVAQRPLQNSVVRFCAPPYQSRTLHLLIGDKPRGSERNYNKRYEQGCDQRHHYGQTDPEHIKRKSNVIIH